MNEKLMFSMHDEKLDNMNVKQGDDGTVIVESSARLHMGFFDLNGGLGRKFGSIGLSLAEPTIQLTAKESKVFSLKLGQHVSEALLEKATKMIEVFLNELSVETSVSVEIKQFVMAHAGLGSGTQLALTLGAALNALFNLNLSTQKIAMLTGRGGRSGIGIAAFDYGGLLIDGGRSASSAVHQSVPPLLVRYDFPEAWRVLLIFDHAEPGIHGSEEKMAFDQLPTFPEHLAAELCRQVLMKAMPAIVEQDLTAFGESIQTIQAYTGDYFAPAQGGRYASVPVSKVLNYLENDGVACFGQSSWGPTGFAVFESEAVAAQYLSVLKTQFQTEQLSFMVTAAQNTGANISYESVN
jgi:beta-RFAP synthase